MSDDITSSTGEERKDEKGRTLCAGIVKDTGEPCRGIALGDAHESALPGGGKYCTGHARAAGLLKPKARGEGLSQASGTARRVRTPLDALRSMMEADPEAYARGIAAMIERGDSRALPLIQRLFEESGQVAMPSTLDEARALPREQRIALLRQIEEKRGPLLKACPHCDGPLLASRLPEELEPASAQA